MRFCGDASPPSSLPLGRVRQLCLTALAFMASSAIAASAATAEPLPDNRGYELVTPAIDGVNAGAPVFGPFDLRVSPDGQRILYPNVVPLPESDSGVVSSYVASRAEDGWHNTALTPRLPLPLVDGSSGPYPFFIALGIGAANGDVTKFIAANGYPLVEENARPGGTENADLYYRTLDDPTLTWVSKPLDLALSPKNFSNFEAANEQGSEMHAVFRSEEPEDPAFPEVTGGMYEWSPGDAHPSLISLDQNEQPVEKAAPGAGFFGLTTKSGSVSSDGSRVVFTAGPAAETIYARVAGRTVVVASQGESSSPEVPRYFGTSNDATRVYFSYPGALPGTGAPEKGGLYVYHVPTDGDPSHGYRQFVMSYGSNGGPVAVSENGRHVYSVSWEEGENPRLFDFSTASNSPTYVATLSPEDSSDWSGYAPWRHARVSPNGRYLLFGSVASGIAARQYDGGGFTQLFLYDAASGEKPACVSCRSGTTPSTDSAVLSYFGTPLEPNFAGSVVTRNVNDAGQAFFNTADPLVSDDTNEVADVYEWVDGAAHLISSGTGKSPSAFIDASESGEDVFFRSFQALVPEKTANEEAIYDARVGGGPPVSPITPECEGEACQKGGGAPQAVQPGSAEFQGEGNATARSDCLALARRSRTQAERASQLRKRASRLWKTAHALAHRDPRKAREMELRARGLKKAAIRRSRLAERLARQAHQCRQAQRREAQ